MKHTLFFVIGSLVLCTSVAFPQFIVTSSVPADGAVGISLSDSVSFTFSEPLDTTVHFGEEGYSIALLASDPLDSLIIQDISFSGDLRTITFEVTHTSNTDFVWMVVGAQSMDDQFLACPYVLNYTTSSSHGSLLVSGTVSFEGGDPACAPVGLLDAPVFSDEGSLRAGTLVPDSTGTYTINYVRDGVYWPVTARDLNQDGEVDPMLDLLGFYDPDHDGQPDSIVVDGSDLTGIDMELQQTVPQTARAYLDTAITIAAGYAPDQELRAVVVGFDSVGLDGTSFGWIYLFYSPSFDFSTTIMISSFFIQADTTSEPEFPSGMRAVPLDFVDSDVALSVAEANGGSEFRAQHDVVHTWLIGGNFYWYYPADTTAVFWVVEYEAIEPDSTTLHLLVDMETGEFLASDIPEIPAVIPNSYILYQNYPNPFNSTTQIRFVLARQGHATVTIFDLLGRQVATVADGEFGPGEHLVRFEADKLSSGIYLYRLQAADITMVKKMILIK